MEIVTSPLVAYKIYKQQACIHALIYTTFLYNMICYIKLEIITELVCVYIYTADLGISTLHCSQQAEALPPTMLNLLPQLF